MQWAPEFSGTRAALRLAGLVLWAVVPLLSVQAEAQELRVVLVQYRIGPAQDLSLGGFEQRIRRIAGRAVSEHAAELLVFPEYLSVFPMVADLRQAAAPSAQTDSAQALSPTTPAPAAPSDHTPSAQVPAAGLSATQRRLVERVTRAPQQPVTPRERRQLRELVRRRVRRYSDPLQRMWSRIADELDVWILAGSVFVEAADGTLRNRAWYFDPQGELVYRQDKVFLTGFESGLLGLEPGALAAARPVTIDGVELGLTICRDSFFDEWHRIFAEVDLWLDIRANGEPWSREVRRRFDTALPERVAQTPVPAGASTSLNGSFRGLLWQGPAFTVHADGRRERQAPDHDATLLLPFTVSAASGEPSP